MTWQPFPLAQLPDPVRDYVVQAANALACDPSYVALPLLTSLGAAIGNSRVVQLKSTWTEPPLLWTLIVGESGTQKSPACELATAFIRHRQDRLLVQHGQALIPVKENFKLGAAHCKLLSPDSGSENPGLPPCPCDSSCQLVAQHHNKQLSPAQRLFVSDITPEALAVQLQTAARGLLLIRDEAAGWLRNFDPSRSSRSGELAHYLTFHRAGRLTLDRRSGNQPSIHIPHAFVAITGTAQAELWPSLMTPAFQAASLIAPRLLLAMPPRPARRWTDYEITVPTHNRLQNVFDRLYDLTGAPDSAGIQPLPVAFNDDAKPHWLRFLHSHAAQLQERSSDLTAAWSKLEAYCPRLALIVHLVRWADNANGAAADVIDAISLCQAIELTRWFAHETERMYALYRNSGDEARVQAKLLLWIRRQGGIITARDILRHFRHRFVNMADVEYTLNRMTTDGLLSMEPVPTGSQGGRPTVIYRLE